MKMKTFRVVVAAASFAAFTTMAQAQARLVTTGTASSTTVAPVAVPANVAVIDSSAFSDSKAGIARVAAVMKQIDTKFQPLRTEIRGMQDRLNTMRADLQKKRATQPANLTAQQTEEAERLEVVIKRKAEDAQASYTKESVAMLDPLQQDIGNALTAYAQAKGISLLIDVNRVPVVYVAATLDITKDFIAEYNRTHPVTATPAPARP
jgi:Skp family chaperone for outer membrane proteins